MYRVKKRAYQGLIKTYLLRLCFDNPNHKKFTTRDFLRHIEERTGHNNWSGIRRHLKFLCSPKIRLLEHHIDKKDAKNNYYSLPDNYLSETYAYRIIKVLGFKGFLGFKQFYKKHFLDRYNRKTKESIIEEWYPEYFYNKRIIENVSKLLNLLPKDKETEKGILLGNNFIKILNKRNQEIEVYVGLRDWNRRK